MFAKTLAPVLLLLFVSSLARCEGNASPGPLDALYDIPRLDNVTIDGRDADWDGRGADVGLLVPIEGPVKSPEDYQARIHLGWNDQGLLVLATIHDDKWIETADPALMWKADSLEVLLADQRGGQIAHWLFSPGMTKDQPRMRTSFDDLRKSAASEPASGPASRPAQATFARTGSGSDCTMELLLPWSSLGIEPKPGREIALQIYANDADMPGRDSLCLVWYPSDKTGKNSKLAYRLRLSDKSSMPSSLRCRAAYDNENLQVAVDVIAPPETLPEVVLTGSGQALHQTLYLDGNGYLTAQFRLPLPPVGAKPPRFQVQNAGRTVGELELSDGDAVRAEGIVHTHPTCYPCVFDGHTLPPPRVGNPARLEALIGPFTLTATYYDAQFNRVTKADNPGRYGAVVDIHAQSGQVYRRFVTLFRTADNLDWWPVSLPVTVDWPSAVGLPAQARQAYPKAVGDFVKWQCVNGMDATNDLAVLLAGLYEAADAPAGTDSFYTNPTQRDRQWWVGMKRKLYHTDQANPQPMVCPRPVQGAPSPTVHEGTLAQAGVDAQAVEKLDQTLTEWSKNTSEAFAVCIVRHGVVVLHKAYGIRDGKPMTVDTPSRMASITKCLSGTLITMAIDQGRLDLDAPITQYLPALAGDPCAGKITLRHLYTHTAGLAWHSGAEDNDMEECLLAWLPLCQVGTEYRYCGTDMELGCKALEAVSGESLPAFYQKHLLGPLGCAHTEVSSASWNAYSTPLDIARIGQLLLNKGRYGDQEFFSAASFELGQPQRLTRTLGENATAVYGLGRVWFDKEGLGSGTFGHGAASAATLRIDPTNDMVIVMTRNSAGENFDENLARFLKACMALVEPGK